MFVGCYVGERKVIFAISEKFCLRNHNLIIYKQHRFCGKKCVEFDTFDGILFMHKTVALVFTLWVF